MLLWGGGPLDRAIYEALYAGDRPALRRDRAGLHGARRADGPDRRELRRCRSGLWLRGHRHLPLVLHRDHRCSGAALSELQKYWIARARPDLEPHLVVVKTSSFPSGHANSSMIFYLTLALALTAGTRWQRPAVAGAIALSLLVGTRRVMLGVHWPSDVSAAGHSACCGCC